MAKHWFLPNYLALAERLSLPGSSDLAKQKSGRSVLPEFLAQLALHLLWRQTDVDQNPVRQLCQLTSGLVVMKPLDQSSMNTVTGQVVKQWLLLQAVKVAGKVFGVLLGNAVSLYAHFKSPKYLIMCLANLLLVMTLDFAAGIICAMPVGHFPCCTYYSHKLNRYRFKIYKH